MHLDQIIAHKREQWAGIAGTLPGERTRPLRPGRFTKAVSGPRVGIIAEVKPRSPSKGDLWPRDAAVPLALSYEAGGAAAVSVLAEEQFFGGGADLVRQVADAVRVPVLFKDFVVDTRQVKLAYAAGADAVLVIVRAVDDPLLTDILDAARGLGLDALVETFTAAEVDRALTAGATLVGVNNRDLDTFEVDLRNSARLRELIPAEIPAVSESGLRDRADVERVAELGFSGCLIGETLLTSPDQEQAVRALTGVPTRGEAAA
ncbi:indole-3-glycerol phosphate synthase TrpC [Actinophytocola sp. KF-1]